MRSGVNGFGGFGDRRVLGRQSDYAAMENLPRFKNNYFDGLPISKKQLFLMFVMIVGVFFEQIDNQISSFIGPNVMASLGVGTADWALMNSVTLIGMFIGGLAGGYVSDALGRKKTFLGSLALVSAMAVSCGLTEDFSHFLAFRLVQGVGVMSMTVVFVTYLLEVTPAEQRGKWEGICAGVGYVAIPFIGALAAFLLPVHEQAWRLFLLAGAGGLVPLVIGMIFLPESPRWLISKGRVKEAEYSVFLLVHRNIDLSDALDRARRHQGEALHGLRAIAELARSYRGRTLVLLVVCIAQTCPMALMSQWNNIILQNMGIAEQASLIVTSVGTLGAPLGCLLGAWMGPMGGRRLAIAASLSIELVVFLSYVFVATSITQDVIVLSAMYLLSQTFANCALICCNPYYGESYPTNIRNFASGAIHSASRLSTSLVMTAVPAVMGAAGFAGMGLLSGGIIIVGVVTVVKWGWPTGRKPLEEASTELGCGQ